MFLPETVMQQCAQLDEPRILNESTLGSNVSVSAVLYRPETGDAHNSFKLEFGVHPHLFAKFLSLPFSVCRPETGNAEMCTIRSIQKS